MSLHPRSRRVAVLIAFLVTAVAPMSARAADPTASEMPLTVDSLPPLDLLIPAHSLRPPDSVTALPGGRRTHETQAASLGYNPFRQAVHRVNQLNLTVTNAGAWGMVEVAQQPIDYFINRDIRRSCEYPRKSYREYLGNMDLWVGARLRRGYAVSTGLSGAWWADYAMKFLPADYPGKITARSTAELYGGPHPDAVSEEDFSCEYVDSLVVLSYYDGFGITSNYNSLKIEVGQQSHAWSYQYAEDIVFFDLQIENVGSELLRDVYIGLHVMPDVRYSSTNLCRDDGEVVGLRQTAPSGFGCGFEDTLNIAWHTDNDGDPWEGEFAAKPGMWLPPNSFQTCTYASARGILGVVPLANPSSLPLKYNWWTSGFDYSNGNWYLYEVEPSADPAVPTMSYEQWDWGVDLSSKRQYRRLGTPEKDFASYLTGIMASGREPWRPIPPHVANTVAQGMSADVLLSWGPFSVWPGAEIPLSFAVVGGENFHTNPGNSIYLPQWPDWWEKYVDFSDIDRNARWAHWIYDNPGFDTDGDGYAGEFRVCLRDSAVVNGKWAKAVPDTQWYKGDGLPDLRATQKPTAPDFWVTPIRNGVHVRFNGQVSETERDVFLQRPDFEGYRVYLGRDERESSLSMVASCDIRNFDKWILDKDSPDKDWRSGGVPLTLEELRCLYGSGDDPCEDTAFDPEAYTVLTPYHHPMFPNDSLFRFEPHGYNLSDFGPSSAIRKVYPDVPDPRRLPPDSMTAEMYTEDGHLKFFEYEFTIENLLPTVGYYVNVTAYDFGSPAAGLYPIESDRTEGLQGVYPLGEWDDPAGVNGKIYVYPNPYLISTDYRAMGLEGRGQEDRWDERVRSIWFANLPPKCTIHIYTLDGDRVRSIRHDMDVGDPEHKRERWGLINRNQQLVETGLYYWVVEIPGGETQVGKLAILR